MSQFKIALFLGLVLALSSPVGLVGAIPGAYAQQCPNGVCP